MASRQLSCNSVLQNDDIVMKQQAGLASQPATHETHRKSPKARLQLYANVNFCLLTRHAGGRGEGGILCNISLIYCLLGYIRIYIETKKKSALNINPACWTCTVIISILYFHLLVYIKSMLLICASP